MGRREKPPTIPQEGDVPFGTKIRAKRWQQGVFLEDFARMVGDYTPSHITQVENNKRNPSPELITKMAQALRTSAKELIEASNDEVRRWIEEGKGKVRNGRHNTLSQRLVADDLIYLIDDFTQKLHRAGFEVKAQIRRDAETGLLTLVVMATEARKGRSEALLVDEGEFLRIIEDLKAVSAHNKDRRDNMAAHNAEASDSLFKEIEKFLTSREEEP